VAAIVAAVAVVAAGGTYLGVRLSSGTGPPTSGLAAVWTAKSQAGNCPSGEDGLPWVTGGLAVACAGNGVLGAYRIGTGQVAWTWHTPKPPSDIGQAFPAIILMSANSDDGIGVFEYTYGQGIAGIVGLDLATGRQLWQLKPQGSAAANIWEGGGRFDILPNSGSALQVYSLATGAPQWSSASSGIPSAGCAIADTAITGPWIYAVTHCSGGADQLYQMSLQTGSVIARAALQDAACKQTSSSDDPTLWAEAGYVLSGCTDATNTNPEMPDIVVIPVGGVQQRALPWTWTGNSDFIENLSEALSPPAIAIGGSTLYIGQSLISNNVEGPVKTYDQIAAIDLNTARLRWYKTITIPGEDPNSVTYPVNVIGADPGGVLDVIENVSSNSNDSTGTTGMTLALLSAANGSISYGPGATYPAGLGNQPSFTLAGRTLLSFPRCPGGCSGTFPVTAYSIGSWPN
jgi:hypothetical protein